MEDTIGGRGTLSTASASSFSSEEKAREGGKKSPAATAEKNRADLERGTSEFETTFFCSPLVVVVSLDVVNV